MRHFNQPKINPHYRFSPTAADRLGYNDIISSPLFPQHDHTYFFIIAAEDLPTDNRTLEGQQQALTKMINRWTSTTLNASPHPTIQANIGAIFNCRINRAGMSISDSPTATPSHGELSPLKVKISNTSPSQVIIILPPHNMTMRQALTNEFGLSEIHYSEELDRLVDPNALFLAQQIASVSALNIQHGQTFFVSALEEHGHSSVSIFFNHRRHGQKIRHVLDAMAAFAVLTEPIEIEHCRKWYIPILSTLGATQDSYLGRNPATAAEKGFNAPLTFLEKLAAILEARIIVEGVNPALIASGLPTSAFIAEAIYGGNDTPTLTRQATKNPLCIDGLVERLQRINDPRAYKLAKRRGTAEVLNAMAESASLLIRKELLPPNMKKGRAQSHDQPRMI